MHPEQVGASSELGPFFSSFISANWPYPPAHLIDVEPATDAIKLSSQFEQYVVDLDNWSLDSALVTMFPSLGDKVRVTTDEIGDAASSYT